MALYQQMPSRQTEGRRLSAQSDYRIHFIGHLPGHEFTVRRKKDKTVESVVECYQDWYTFHHIWDTAETLVEALEEFIDAQDVLFMRENFRRCYLGLAGFALSRKAKQFIHRKKYLALGKKMLKWFKTDMKDGSVNAFPIVRMLEAEESPSKEKYDSAIKACARLGLIHHEAYKPNHENNDDQCNQWINIKMQFLMQMHGGWISSTKRHTVHKTNYSDVTFSINQ